MGRQLTQCQEQSTHGITGTRGRGTKWYVCGTGDGGTAKQNGGENEQGFSRD